jgi:glycosyltransferase involved in cell wall biosynthesis
MKKKILIFGPISDFGGRELEVGFLAKIFSQKYNVDICSTGRISCSSQVFTFNPNQKVITVNKLICRRYFYIKFFSIIGWLKNSVKGNLFDYASNKITNKFFNFKTKALQVIKDLVVDYDLIIICGQFSSQYISELVHSAKKCKVKVIFRTTGTIINTGYNFLSEIDLLIFHSIGNSKAISTSNFSIIDQCAFLEKKLLKIPLSTKVVTNFLVVSRISPEKGIQQIIEFFISTRTVNDKLYIAGNGILEDALTAEYKGFEFIIFTGFVDSSALYSLINKMDCIIIPSPAESGPLVGVESMCAGKIIISTPVGAMNERLFNTTNNFWYDYGDLDSFRKVFIRVKKLKAKEIEVISNSLRINYLKYYSIESISSQYLGAVNFFLK